MPTSTNVTNLKINELTEAQYDTAVSGGVIGANELSILTDVDEAIQVSTMPTAGADELGKVYQFIGTTDANYTHGYFYECVSDGQQPATYSWSNIQVQASSGGLPSQTGNAGKFLTTDGTDASWSDIVPQTSSSSARYIYFGDTTGRGNDKTGAIAIGYTPFTNGSVGSYSISIGDDANAKGQYGVAIGSYSTVASGTTGAHAFGYHCTANANYAIQIGYYATNNDSKTFKVGFAANENYEIMSADGTIPTDRFTTTPSADGTYYPTLSISSGTATRSWGTISALQNTATGTNSLTIGGTATNSNYAVNIGYSTDVRNAHGLAIGSSAVSMGAGSIAIGRGASQTSGQGNNQIAIGYNAHTAGGVNSVQIGQGTNSTANTVCFGNANGNFEIMSADGTIPTARLTKVNSTITLTSAGWSSNTQTVTVNGVTSTSVVLVAPDPSDTADYVSAGILCTSQATNSLTFTATTTPTNDIDVNIVCL